MNEESIYLLKSLKAFLLKESPGAFHGDWPALIRLANIHSVTGILGYTVMNYPDASNAEVSGFLRRQCLQTISVFSRRAEAMKQLITKMDEQGIDHLLFKGYILKDYYPVPELRSFGDIDFLIHPEDRARMDALMLREGYQRKTDWEPVYSYYKDFEYYEIHTDVMEVDVSDKADYKGYYQHVWEHARRTAGHTWELSPEYHFLYLLTHIAKHISGSGAGIRMYLDIAVFIRHFGGQLDWTYIRRELQALCFTDFANVVLTVVQVYFSVESQIPLHEMEKNILDDFMEFTMAGGTFGHAGRDAGLISLKTQNRSGGQVSRAQTLLRRMFPTAASLEKRYTYLQGRYWLLPAAWVHRMIRTRDTWGAHADEAKSILQTDTEEVLKLNRIYKEIGL